MTFIKSNWKYILGLVVVLVLWFWGRQEYQQWKQHIIDQAQKANTQTVVTLPPQVINTKTETIREVTVQAPTVEQATNDIATRINNKDSTLPRIALEKTDRTVVVSQQLEEKDGTKDWQVGVYTRCICT